MPLPSIASATPRALLSCPTRRATQPRQVRRSALLVVVRREVLGHSTCPSRQLIGTGVLRWHLRLRQLVYITSAPFDATPGGCRRVNVHVVNLRHAVGP